MNIAVPWLGTIIFGFTVFLIGRRLQASEKAKRESRAEQERLRKIAQAMRRTREGQPEPEGVGTAGALRGPGQKHMGYDA